MVLFEMTIPETVTSEEMEPTEIPWPPEQVFPVKTMLEPLLMARQSSWFFMTLFLIVFMVGRRKVSVVLLPSQENKDLRGQWSMHRSHPCCAPRQWSHWLNWFGHPELTTGKKMVRLTDPALFLHTYNYRC